MQNQGLLPSLLEEPILNDCMRVCEREREILHYMLNTFKYLYYFCLSCNLQDGMISYLNLIFFEEI